MKMPFKVALMAMLGVVAMAFASSYMLTNLVGRDSDNLKQSFLMQLRRSTRALLEVQSEQISDQLAKTVELESQAVDKISELKKGEFIAVGLIHSVPGDPQPWSAEWIESLNPKMNSAWMNGLIAMLPLESVRANEVSWVRVATDDGQIFFLLLVEVQIKTESGLKSKISFGVVPTSIFSNINLVSKGEDNSVFVVDGQGTTFSYPDQQYVGSKISTHPIVANLVKTQSIEFTGQLGRSRNDAVIGGHDRISNTNLYVVAASPVQTQGEVLTQFIFQISIVCIGLMLIVSLAVLYFLSREKQKMSILEQNMELMKSASGTGSLVIESGEDRLREFARGIASYLRAPTASIVGLVQIADNKNADKNLKDSLDKIAGEARKMRSFSEALTQVAGASDAKQEILELNPILSQVMNTFRNEMSKAKINFEENFKADLNVRANHNELKNSIKSIFAFVLSVLKKSGNDRKILLNIEKQGGLVLISIEGRGVELKNEERKKIFLPFETRLPSSRILDLDLSLAQNYVREINGEVQVSSIGAEGFRISVSLPTATKVTEQPIVASAIAPEEKVASPSFILKSPAKITTVNFPPTPKADKPIDVQVQPKPSLDKEVKPAPENKVQTTEKTESDIQQVEIRSPKLRIDT